MKLNTTDKKQLTSEELIKRTEVENSPFIIININDEYFGTLGKYRITEIYNNFNDCKNDLEKITWNRITQVIQLIFETLKNNK